MWSIGHVRRRIVDIAVDRSVNWASDQLKMDF